jgi:hypothetical protein
VTDFKERFGLGCLGGTGMAQMPATPNVAGSLPAEMEDALLSFGSTVLAKLKSGDEKVFTLARQLGRRVDELDPVIKYLVERGYVERAVNDPIGDDTLRLTERGRKLV